MTGPNRVSTDDHVAIIGLTGGIATGKSTVSKMLNDLGARVIDADVVAREVVEPGTPGLSAIVDTFGDQVLLDDGTLDRAALGEIIFGDADARKKLNAITHPRIAMRMMEHATEAGQSGFRWVIYDAALIVENNIHHALAGLIVVTCSPETQFERLMERDEFSEEQARERIASQLPLSEKEAAADWVIDNDGTLDQTEQQVRAVFEALSEKFGRAREA